MQTMTARRNKKASKQPRLRKPSPQPAISPEELDARRETLKKIGACVRTGRPPIYETPEELQDAVDSYFAQCAEVGFLPTVAGLQYHIGMYSKDIWNEIERRGEEFSGVSKSTQLRMQDYKFQAAAAGAMDRSVYIFDAVNHHNHVNTRTESKNDNRNSGRTEIEAISIRLVSALPPSPSQPVIECDGTPLPQISATTEDSDDL